MTVDINKKYQGKVEASAKMLYQLRQRDQPNKWHDKMAIPDLGEVLHVSGPPWLDFLNIKPIFYSLCCRLCVSSYRTFTVFSFFCHIPDFYAKVAALYAKILCSLVFYVQYRARCVRGGVEAPLASYLF